MKKLSISEVEFDKGSVVDPAGIVFHYDNKIFRAIRAEYAELYKFVIESTFFNDLVEQGLIETKISDYSLEGFDLILEHKKINVISKWTEWSPSMIKDSVLMMIRLNIVLAKNGLILKDSQPGNVQFVNGKAIWIDFGSIDKLDNSFFPITHFRVHNILPLWLMSINKKGLAKQIYSEAGIKYFKKLSNRRFFKYFPWFYYKFSKGLTKDNIVKKLRQLEKNITHLKISIEPKFWSGYGQGGRVSVEDVDSFKPKPKAVYEVLKSIEPGLVLDMAGNKGWYCELALSLGNTDAICFDLDEESIDYLYNKVKKEKLPITPLCMDFLYPTPSYSLALGKSNSYERLKGDNVLVLAILHHLVFKENIRFDTFVEIVSNYTRKNAIIEFIPKEDIYVSKWYSEKYNWYSLENFIIELKKYFSEIEVFESYPSPRKLLLCKKRTNI